MPGEFASIGNANIDLTLRVRALPEADNIVQAIDVAVGTGGSASNYAYTIVRMGAKAHFFGAVGDDIFGRYFLSELSSSGVDTSHVEVVRGRPTGFVTIWLDQSGEKRGVAWRGANELVEPRPDWSVLDTMDIVHLAGCSPRVARWVWANVRAPKTFDPGSSIHLYTDRELLEALRVCRVTYLHTEAVRRLGLGEQALRELLGERGVLVEKMGAQGVRVHSSTRTFRVKPPKVEPVDTTGAGDVFSAVFDFKLAAGDSPAEAAIWATAASSLKIGRAGAKQGVPSYNELEAYLESARHQIGALYE